MSGEEEDEEYYTVDYIKNKKVSHGKVFYLVKWKEFDDEGCTWEPEESFEGINYYFIEQYNKKQEDLLKIRRELNTESPSSTSARSSNSPIRNKRKKTPESFIQEESTTDDIFTQICPVKVKVKDMEVVESESEENISEKDMTEESKNPSSSLMKEAKVPLNQIKEVKKEKTKDHEEKKMVPIKDEPMKEIADPQNQISPSGYNVHGMLGIDTIEEVVGMKPNHGKDDVVVELAWKVRKDGMKPFNSFCLLNDVRKVDSVALCDFLCSHIAFLKKNVNFQS